MKNKKSIKTVKVVDKWNEIHIIDFVYDLKIKKNKLYVYVNDFHFKENYVFNLTYVANFNYIEF